MLGARFSDGLVQIIVDATARATVLLTVIWAATWLARRSSAAVRHQLWTTALCGLVILPAASWLIPGWQIPSFSLPSPSVEILERSSSRSVSPQPLVNPTSPPKAMPSPGQVVIVPEKPAVQPTVTNPAIQPSVRLDAMNRSHRPVPVASAPLTITDLCFPIWFSGFLMTMLPMIVGIATNEVRRRRSRPVTNPDWLHQLESIRQQLSIRRTIGLRQGRDSLIPLTWGVIRPIVLIPEGADHWPATTQRFVLLHELAHIQRCDIGFQLVSRFAVALYWFHPMVWYAFYRMRIECEHACDDSVINTGECATDYASQLLQLVRSLRAARFSAAEAMSRRSTLEKRVFALFDESRRHGPLKDRARRRLVVIGLMLIVGLATVNFREQSAGASLPGNPTARSSDEPRAVANPPSKGSGRITGRVVLDQNGEAVGNAEVLLLPPPPHGQQYYYGGRYPFHRARSDSSGAFSFDGLTPGRYRVWANLGKLTSRLKSGDGQVVVLSEGGEAPQPSELRLVPGVAIRAKVKDRQTGRPIAGATVSITWSDFETDPTTDQEGQVLIQPLRAEVYHPEVWADGYARESQAINLENRADAELEFQLGPGGTVEGVVRDPTGRPLADVGLSVSVEKKYTQICYVETDRDGHYQLKSLPRDLDLRINLSKQDFGRKDVAAKVTAEKMSLDLTLEPRPDGGSITGVVLDDRGKPIADAELTNMGTSSADVREAKSGPDGRFRMDNLYESGSMGKEVLVRARGFAPRRVKVETGTAAQPADTTIALEAGHRIKGRVIDGKGNPLEGVRVYFAQGNHGFTDGGSGTTNQEGHFSFDSLPPNSPFSFQKEGFSEIDGLQLALDTDQIVTVAMEPAGLIAGRVVDATSGKPVKAFNVSINFSPKREPGEPSSGLWSELVAPGQNYQSEAGQFQLGRLVTGMPLQVAISAPGYERAVIERVVVATPSEVKIEEYRLSPIARESLRSYRGRLLDAEGHAIVGAQLRLIVAKNRAADQRQDFPFNWQMIENGQIAQQSQITRFLESTTDRDGRFVFDQIPKDHEAELVWWRKGIAPGRLDHLEQYPDEEQGSIELKLAAPARVVGTVDRAAFPGNVRVRVSPTNLGLPDADLELKPGQNEFEIGDLAAGEYWVALNSPYERIEGQPNALTSRSLASERVTIQAGESHRVRFEK